MGFAKETIQTLIWQVLTMPVGIISSILLARYLGPEGRGGYAIVLLVVTLLAVIGNFGTPGAAVYLIGQKLFPFKQIIISQGLFSIFSGVCLVFISVILFNYLHESLFHSIPNVTYYIAAVAIIPQMLCTHIRHFALGLKRIQLYNVLIFIDSVLLLGIIIIFIATTTNFDLFEAVLCFSITSMLSLISHLVALLSLGIAWQRSTFNLKVITYSLRFGYKLFITGFGGTLMQRLNLIFLGFYHNTTTVGYYAVALALPNLFVRIPNIVSLVFYPWIASFSDKKDADKLASSTLRNTIFLCVCLSIPAIVLAEPIIIMFYGADYEPAVNAMRILIIGVILSGISGIAYNYLAGRGYPGHGVILTFLNLVSLLLLGFLFVPSGGVIGAALAKTIAQLFGAIFILFMFVKINSTSLRDSIFLNRDDVLRYRGIIKNGSKWFRHGMQVLFKLR